MIAPEEFLVGVLLVWFLVYLFVILDNAFSSRLISRPRISITQIRSDPMADLLTYLVSAGPVVDGDVVERQLTVVVDGVEVADASKVYDAAATDLGTVTVPQGAAVVLTLVDVDDAGNRSEPAVAEFVAEDTLPPAKPGAFGVTLVSETRAEVVPEPTDVVPEEPTDVVPEEPTSDET